MAAAAPDDPPPHLSAKQQNIWRYAMQHAPDGLLRSLDAAIFESWVVAHSLHRDATEQINKFGPLVKMPGSSQPQVNPWLSILNKQARIMAQAAAEMGFTPSSRSRVKLEKPAASGADPFAGLKELAPPE